MADRALETAAQHLTAGRLEQARAVLSRIIQRSPGDAAANTMMSALLGRLGQFDQAEYFARRAAAAAPDRADAHFNLGRVLEELGRGGEAAESYGAAAALDPRDATSRRKQVLALAGAWRLADALAAADEGLRATPDDGDLLGVRAHVLLLMGRARESVQVLRGAVAAHPDAIPMARALAMTAIYDDVADPAVLLDLHRRAGELLERSVPDRPAPFPPGGDDPERPLRIGFVSSDLRDHVVAVFLAPILAGLDRAQFTAVCYSTAAREDGVSAALRAMASG